MGALTARILRPPVAPAAVSWRGEEEDPVRGSQPITGLLSRPRGGSRRLAVLVHGLGGSSRSSYMSLLASAAEELGFAALRLDLRGAGKHGTDLYHAGLTDDLAAALADKELRRFEEVVLAGVSVGGHVALRYATQSGDPRLRAVAAVSSPLDLAAGVDAIDRPWMAPYRAYLFRGLRAHGERAWRAGALDTTPERLRRVRTVREWDTLTVARRFGFADAADYYARASVGPRLGALRCPALLLAAEWDPMIPPRAIRPALEAAGRPRELTVHWSRRGGHLAFPRDVDLGLGAGTGFARQTLSWLASRTGV